MIRIAIEILGKKLGSFFVISDTSIAVFFNQNSKFRLILAKNLLLRYVLCHQKTKYFVNFYTTSINCHHLFVLFY